MCCSDRLSCPAVLLHKYTRAEFTFIKSAVMTGRRFRQCRTLSRSVMNEKSLFPLFSVDVWVQWLHMTAA